MSEENGNTVFQNQEPAEPNQAPVEPSAPSSAPVFSIPEEAGQYIGEGKKYQTVEDALKSVPHAQQYIGELKQEMETLKEDLSKRKTAEELLSELKEKQSMHQDVTPTPQQPVVPDVGRLVADAISQEKAKEIRENNLKSVDSKLKEMYGEKANQVYSNRADQLGMSNTQLMELAANSPNAFMELFNTVQKEPAPAKSNSSVNPEALGGQTTVDTPPSIMGGASTEQMLSAWDYAKRNVEL